MINLYIEDTIHESQGYYKVFDEDGELLGEADNEPYHSEGGTQLKQFVEAMAKRKWFKLHDSP